MARRPDTPRAVLDAFEHDVPLGRSRVSLAERLAHAKVPGVAVAAVSRNSVAWVHTAGIATGDSTGARPRPVDVDTVFQAASLSKPVTALAILDLVASNRIALDDDVRDLLGRDIPVHRIAQRAANGPVCPPGSLTVRLVLAHRSGIAGRDTTPTERGRGFRKGGGGSLRQLRTRSATSAPNATSWDGDPSAGVAPVVVTYPPGTRESYSGAGYLVLQSVVEAVTGRRFAAHLDAAVLEPLGMNRSTFADDVPADWEVATGHDPSGDAIPGGRELIPWSAAGGLHCTVMDYVRVVAAINGAPSTSDVAPPDLVRVMRREGLGVFPAAVGTDDERWSHGGSNGGFRSLAAGSAADSLGLVVLANGRGADGEALRNDIAMVVRRTLSWAW